MIYLVEALDTYEKNNISDNELGRVPSVGEQFEVSKERLDVLLGNNKHSLVFVKLVEKYEQEEKVENKPEKKVKKKKTK